MDFGTPDNQHASWRARLHDVIFEANTLWGKRFDVVLMICILLSVMVVLLDSVELLKTQHRFLFYGAEWFFTVLFTIEYLLRLITVARPGMYARSFYGIVDLLAILPTYISVLLPGTQYLLVIRILRVLRIFRVLKFAQYVGEANDLMRALNRSRRKITVFLFAVMTNVVIFGSIMYLIEGRENGFTSIPRSIYWAIVTLTTVGYGDIAPKTGLGQAVSAIIMIMGYGIIAVPTGIVTAEMTSMSRGRDDLTRSCDGCGGEGHAHDALFCKHCGEKL